MGALWRSLLVTVALLATGVVWAQEPKQGWLGAELQDVTKEEADKLGWDTPRGAKVTAASPGSPADKAGVKAGDIVVAFERTQIDTASELDAAIEAKAPGAQVLLSVLSGGRERRVTATLAERPKAQTDGAGTGLHLMLDTGGHKGLIRSLAFTPDGKQMSLPATTRWSAYGTGSPARPCALSAGRLVRSRGTMAGYLQRRFRPTGDRSWSAGG